MKDAFSQGHAFLVQGDVRCIPLVLAELKRSGIEENDPDLYVSAHKGFGVEHARELTERAALRPVGERGRVFIVSAESMTADAQNALLKTLEEPPAGARFILIVSSPNTMLMTVRSRTTVVLLEGEGREQTVDAEAFLKAQPSKRIEMLKAILDTKADEERNTGAAVSLLAALEERLAPHADEQAVREGIRALWRARALVTDKGSLMKVLLEQAALLVPVR